MTETTIGVPDTSIQNDSTSQVTWEATAIHADLNARTIATRLLPIGEPGQTSQGVLTVEAGAIALPADPSIITLNLDHERSQPVGRATRVEERGDAIYATFDIARTPEGDATLADARDPKGIRRRMSAEFDATIAAGGRVVKGRLYGAAILPQGAFSSAQVLAAEATPADLEALATYIALVREQAQTVIDNANAAEAALNATPETTEDETASEDTTAGLPAEPEKESEVLPDTEVHAAKVSPSVGLAEMRAITASIHAGTVTDTQRARLDNAGLVAQHQVFAALSDVKYDATGSPIIEQRVPQWLADINEKNDFEQKYVPLITTGDLTQKKVAGFKWNVKPAGAAWAGNKSNIPSNSPSTTPWEDEAELWAGGHDIAIEHRLFGHAGFFEAYGAAMLESYKRYADSRVLAEILTAATANSIEADNPAGLEVGAGVSALVDGIFAVAARDYTPTFALLAPDVYKGIFKRGHGETLGYVSAQLGFTDGQLGGFQFRLANELTPGQIVVGTRSAAKLLELPGVPLRADAPDLVKGGLDVNYYAALYAGVTNPSAFALVTPYTP